MTKDFEAHLQRNNKLLDVIKVKLPELEVLLKQFVGQYEDGVYRFYHQSFKVYALQHSTVAAFELFKQIGTMTDSDLCREFEQIVKDGSGVKFEISHNEDWLLHTRPIVEAFLHAKYFLEMMVKCAREMGSAPTTLPSAWAAVLELYGQR